MNGIVINIDPMAFSLGSIHINWYSIFVILAIVSAIGIAIWEGKRKGFSADSLLSLAPWVVLGGIIGARLFHVVDHWGQYAANPIQIFMFQQGGLAIWGALVGGAVAAIVYSRVRRISFLRLADTLVPALLVAQIVGRFACIIDGDAVGGPTTLPWAFTYINPDAMVPSGLIGVPVHPYPIYDQLWNLLGLAIALKLRRHLKTDGLLFFSYLSLYAVGRFVLSFVRQENVWFWGLQEAQVIAVGILLVSIAMCIYLTKKSSTSIQYLQSLPTQLKS
jgi:phosphatidylglycerol---prolipoprotein diacylglyceryl transferase